MPPPRRGKARALGSSFHGRFMHECLLEGVEPQARSFVDTPGGGFALAGCGMGAFLYHLQPGIVTLPGLELFYPLTLHWRQGEHNPVAQAFYQTTRRFELA